MELNSNRSGWAGSLALTEAAAGVIGVVVWALELGFSSNWQGSIVWLGPFVVTLATLRPGLGFVLTFPVVAALTPGQFYLALDAGEPAAWTATAVIWALAVANLHARVNQKRGLRRTGA